MKRTHSLLSFSAEAKDLNHLVNRWFNTNVMSGASPRSLVKQVNEIAANYGVICGAVAVIDSQTTQFNHLSSYPKDDQKLILFPILQPDNQRETRKLRGLGIQIRKQFDPWLRDLFELQRNAQKASDNRKKSQTPDDLSRSLHKLVIRPAIIREHLQLWLDILAIAGFLLLKKQVTIDRLLARPLKTLAEENGLHGDWATNQEFVTFEKETNLLKCVSSFAATPEFEEIYSSAVEYLFFGRNRATKRRRTIRLLKSYLSLLTLGEVRGRLDCDRRYNINEGRPASLPRLLFLVHKRAKFPLVQYLLVNLFYSKPVCHVAWPFFKTLSYHPGTDVGKLSFPGRLYLAIAVNGSWRNAEIIEHLYPFFLLMKVAMEPFADEAYYSGIERDRAKMEGRLEEKQYQFFATSHELKDLTKLIPKAGGKGFILEGLRDAFLTYSLPAASKLNEGKDKPYFPPAVYGCKPSGKNAPVEPCADYHEWLSQLVQLAAKTQAIAIPGIEGCIANSASTLAKWQNEIASHFDIRESLKQHSLPKPFEHRCLLSIAILCAVRNVIKHSFGFSEEPDPETDVIIAQTWSYYGTSPITIDCCRENTEWFLEIRNPHDGKDTNSGSESDGTQSAIAFYLKQIGERMSPPRELRHENVRGKTDFRCLRPLLRGEVSKS